MANSDNSTAAPLGEWIIAGLLAGNVAWTTLCLGGVRPETMVLSWGLTGITLALQLVTSAWSGGRAHPAGFWLLPFLVYAAISVAAITPVPWIGKREWLVWAQVAACFWISLNGLRHSWPRLLVMGMVLGLAVSGVVFAAYQRFIAPDWLMMNRTQVTQYIGRASGCFGNPNNFAALLILIVPPVLSLAWQRGASAVQRVLYGYLALVLLLGLGLTISRGGWLALALALACWPLFARTQTWASRILLSATALGAVLMAGAALYSTVPLVKARLDDLAEDRGERSRPILWTASTKLFSSAPLLGTGAGSFNTLFERHRPERFNDEPQWTHNEYLNTLSDYGLVGFVLLFGAVVVLGGKVVARSGSATAMNEVNAGWRAAGVTHAMSVGLLAFATACFVDFHLKIPALGMTVALISAEIVRRHWPADEPIEPTPWRQLGGIVAAIAVVIGTLAIALPTYQAESSRYLGRQKIDALALTQEPTLNQQKETFTEARALFGEALAFDDSNGQAWADSAYASALWSHLAPQSRTDLGREAEISARQALARSKQVPEFWIRLGVALDMQGRWSEGSEAFLQALTLAPASSLAWYHQAYHLSLNPRANKLALVAVDTCLRLDPTYLSARSLRQRLSSAP
jgi:O-antigen ligase/cytochrome c-type biogenesis protein CcmH/NrfG